MENAEIKAEKQALLEKWSDVINKTSGRSKAVREDLKETSTRLLENEEKWLLNEAPNVAGDIIGYTPILIPAVRRIMPNLLAHDLVGVQPLAMPTGYAFALRYSYAASPGVTNLDRGKFNRTTDASLSLGAKPVWGGNAVKLVDPTILAVVGDT